MRPCLCLLLACFASLEANAASLAIDLAQGWISETEGAWRMRYDHRDLLAMRHPWQASEKGAFALVWRMITLPEDWNGPATLSFYCSDDYHTDDTRSKPSSGSAEGFIGHRFKQVLVNNKVLWHQDLSDPVRKGESPYFRITLPVKPGETFRLTLLVYDAEASHTILKEDFYHSQSSGSDRAKNPKAFHFMSHVYWGDLLLMDGEAQQRPQKRPSETRVLAVHAKRWPLAPFGEAWEEASVQLKASIPAPLPQKGFPVLMNIPFPAGKLTEAALVRLETMKQQALFSQKKVLSRWPDDSIRWMQFSFQATAATTELTMAFKKDHAKASKKLLIKESEEKIAVDTGAIQFDLQHGDPLGALSLRKKALIPSIGLAIGVNGTVTPGTSDFFRVIEEGAYSALLAVDGRFDAMDRQMASYTLYLRVFAGMPYVQCWLRIFNDSDKDLPLSSLQATLDLDQPVTASQAPGMEAAAPAVDLHQPEAQRRSANTSAVDPLLPAYLTWDHGLVALRRFRELFPKRISAKDKTVVLDFVAADTAPLSFTPGEAKSHEFWISLDPTEPAAFAATVEHPPVYMNADYFCASGVLGPAKAQHAFPKLVELMQRQYHDKSWTDLGQHLGLRHFPDAPYAGGLPNWSNNYYARVLGAWSAWFLTGERKWHDRAVDLSRHIMDVAVIYSPIPEKNWHGAMHGPGKNHVGPPWNPTLRIAGLELHEKCSNDPGVREAYLGVADYCVAQQAGIDGGSIRQQAGPFDSICTAYAETGEPVFLDDGALRVASVWRAMDRRRGVWPDEHGSQVYRGNIPWMAAQLARPLYWWYYLSGDVEAAQALVGLAESIICENTDWDTPGAVSGYSHNPAYPMTANYDLLLLPMIFAAYELTEDEFFLEAAKAQWARWLEQGDSLNVFNTYWNTPWLLWYLHHYQLVEETKTSVQETP